MFVIPQLPIKKSQNETLRLGLSHFGIVLWDEGEEAQLLDRDFVNDKLYS